VHGICDDYFQLIFGKTDGTAAPFEVCMRNNNITNNVVDADNCQTALIKVFDMCFTNGTIEMHEI
jgi:hypothetical protein